MKLFCIVLFASLVSIPALASPLKTKKPSSIQNNFSDSLTTKIYAKKTTVRLSPNPTSNGMVTISSVVNEPLHFYVFDVEGTLLYRIALKPKEQKKIKNLKKGVYMYDVFKNDESIEQGKIIAE